MAEPLTPQKTFSPEGRYTWVKPTKRGGRRPIELQEGGGLGATIRAREAEERMDPVVD
jgi:hypothetical protein